jgi:CDP-glycerol glycerophosphotransferase (TagB/SpsB family)
MMSLRNASWKIVDRVRAIDQAVTRRDGKRAVLIDSRTAMNYVMAAPIQAALSRDPRVRFYATSTDTASPLSAIYHRALPGTTVVTPRSASLMRFDAYLTADLLWASLPRGTKRIQMFHGVGGKFSHDYDTPQSSMRRWHRFFFVNRRRMQNFINAKAIDATSDAPRLVGMPKVDCLVDGSIDRDDVLRRLQLDPSRPTILYAPTWSAASSLNLMGIELLEGLLRRPWNVLVKLHDRSRDPRPFYSGGVDWVAKIGAVLKGRTGRLVEDADICPYLAAADAMISDHSSAGFEYLLLDRPLVRIHVPQLIDTSNIAPEYLQLLMDASHSVDGPADTLDAIERGLADPSIRSASRRAVAEDLFYRAGSATARAVAEMYEVLELSPVPHAPAIPAREPVV